MIFSWRGKRKKEQWVVGPEYETQLFHTLGSSLRVLGYVVEDSWWGVGGSQEISIWRACGPKGELVIEAETYIGLTVSGNEDIVSELRTHFFGANPINLK